MRDRSQPASADATSHPVGPVPAGIPAGVSSDPVVAARLAGRSGPGRRQFLIGAAATALLAACGDDGSGPGPDEAASEESELSVVRFFGPYFGVGQPARVPFGIADTQGLLPAEATPEAVTVSVTDPSGAVILEPTSAPRRMEGLPRPYYTFSITPEVVGFYDLVLDVDGAAIVSQFEVVAADAPGVAGRIGPGDAFPTITTPTVADPMGLTPLCTRTPPCELHEASVDTLLGTTPVVALVATPAFCQTIVCGPVLDVLLGEIGEFPGVDFLHLEVFTNPSENQVPPVPEDFAPIIGQLGLSYEPVLYTIDADGIVVDRLDYIFAAEEMRDAIARLV